MAYQIRCGVFETNSSSTHSFAWATEEEYKQFQDGELFAAECLYSKEAQDRYGGKRFFTLDELREVVRLEGQHYDTLGDFNPDTASKKELLERAVNDDIARLFDDGDEWSNLEWYEEHITTPSGDKIVCFGEYGRDD